MQSQIEEYIWKEYEAFSVVYIGDSGLYEYKCNKELDWKQKAVVQNMISELNVQLIQQRTDDDTQKIESAIQMNRKDLKNKIKVIQQQLQDVQLRIKVYSDPQIRELNKEVVGLETKLRDKTEQLKGIVGK